GDVHVLLEEDLDHAVAAQRLRFDVLDVADLRGQVALIEVDDPPGHVVRRKPVVGPDHADDRDVDVGEDVDRGAPRGEHAEDGDEQGEDDKGVGPPQGDLYDPHVSRLPG